MKLSLLTLFRCFNPFQSLLVFTACVAEILEREFTVSTFRFLPLSLLPSILDVRARDGGGGRDRVDSVLC